VCLLLGHRLGATQRVMGLDVRRCTRCGKVV
jgi:hypothetical protein